MVTGSSWHCLCLNKLVHLQSFFVCLFFYFFKTGFLCVALVVLELTQLTMLVSISEIQMPLSPESWEWRRAPALPSPLQPFKLCILIRNLLLYDLSTTCSVCLLISILKCFYGICNYLCHMTLHVTGTGRFEYGSYHPKYIPKFNDHHEVCVPVEWI